MNFANTILINFDCINLWYNMIIEGKNIEDDLYEYMSKILHEANLNRRFN